MLLRLDQVTFSPSEPTNESPIIGPSSRAAPSGLLPRRPSGVAQRSGSAVGRRRSSSASGAQRLAALPQAAPTTRRPSAATRRSGAVPPPPKTRSFSKDNAAKIGACGISIAVEAAAKPAATLPMPYSLRTRNPQTVGFFYLASYHILLQIVLLNAFRL